MNIIVNGAPCVTGASTVEQVLGELGYGALRVATALDGAFVPKARRAQCVLAEGSALEIVAPMQGG